MDTLLVSLLLILNTEKYFLLLRCGPQHFLRLYKAFFKICTLARCTQPAFTCTKLAIETPEQDVKYVQS